MADGQVDIGGGDKIRTVDLGGSGKKGLGVAMLQRFVPFTSRAIINTAASGDTTLVAAVAAKTIRVHKLFLVAGGAVNFKLKDGTTDFHPALPLTASGASFVLDMDGEPWYVTTAGNGLILNLSAAVQVSGVLYYTQG